MSLRPSVSEMLAGVTMTFLSTYVTDSNDAILNEVGRTTAVPLLGPHQRPEGASGHSFQTPPRSPAGQRQSWGLDWYDYPELATKFP
jgi:hypothetical protein